MQKGFGVRISLRIHQEMHKFAHFTTRGQTIGRVNGKLVVDKTN